MLTAPDNLDSMKTSFLTTAFPVNAVHQAMEETQVGGQSVPRNMLNSRRLTFPLYSEILYPSNPTA